MPKKKIVIIANVPVWTIPGLEELRHGRHYATWLEPLIPAFANQLDELELHWITFSKEASEVIEHQAFGQTFHVLPRSSLAVSMMTGYLSEVRQIKRLVSKIAPDLIHAWGSEDVCGIAGARSGVTPKLFTLQGCLSDYVERMGGSFLFRLQALFEKPTVGAYRHGTAESPGAADLLRGMNPEMEVELIDYGVNYQFFDALWNPPEKPTVLFVGGVNARKGISDLIAVAGREDCSDIDFRIAGDGSLRQELAEVSTPNVVWLGNCNREQVVAELENAWVLAIPTLADTGPTVVKEARVVGLPIITTTAAGASCYVEDAGCGFVVGAENRDQLAVAISNVCSSRDTCIETGRQGWTDHREILHPKTTAHKFIEKYKSLILNTNYS